MGNPNGVKSVMVEFNRFGGEGGTLQKDTEYLRTTGYEKPVMKVKTGIGYDDFDFCSNTLRYAGATPEEIAEAKSTFEKEAADMLRDLQLPPGGTLQIDLVSGAAELWAFPFEAYAGTKRGVVLTRRIRAEFTEHPAWPPIPKILFAHAAIGTDLPKSLIEKHTLALRAALEPWTGDNEEILKKYLVVREVYSLADLAKARAEGKFTHIHLLAHGKPVKVRLRSNRPWGVRLGAPAADAIHPEDIAAALAPQDGLPVAITVASCDSANQASSASAKHSIAQELHLEGIPVVVASQLPLTMNGSVVMTQRFYEPLLRGEDVRHALDDMRDALRNANDAGHDWLSVVAYVRLPETYERHRSKVRLQMELAMLRAAQKRMDAALAAGKTEALDEVERSIRARIKTLGAQFEQLNGPDDEKDRLECQGLLASAYKRLAELLFLAGRNPQEQLESLKTSLQHYSAAFQSNLNMHWHGVQKLALQAVLDGTFDPIEYEIVMRAARNDNRDYWHLGTLAELHLLSTFAKKEYDCDAACQAVNTFRDLAIGAGKPEDVDSTRLQLRRYVKWWTADNQFKTNLKDAAEKLVALLP